MIKLLLVLFFLNQNNLNISPNKLKEIIDKDNPIDILIDVRTLEEVNDSKIPNSINIDYYHNSFEKSLDSLDKNFNYFIYCRSGNRSMKTVNILKSKGFEKAFNLQGGIIAWKEEGFITISIKKETNY
tara:strand:+ start:430 stop:813 length:384 start_codon:yes stop_codon:yes gene_type:complete